MVKSIYQYRYFGEDYADTRFKEIDFSGTSEEAIKMEFSKRIEEGVIYIRQDSQEQYVQLDKKSKYNKLETYYELKLIYKKINFNGTNSENKSKFEEMLKNQDIFIYQNSDETYIKLNSNSEYDPNTVYYEIAERQYVKIDFDNIGEDRIIEVFTERLNENELYVFQNSIKNYVKLGEDANYSSLETYYEVDFNSRLNYPASLTKNNLSSGSAFDKHTPITKLGIQSFPGLKFQINSNTNWIIVGMTGIYELDLTQSSGVINKLRFDKTSLDIIDQHENAYLIIDIMSEMEG